MRTIDEMLIESGLGYLNRGRLVIQDEGCDLLPSAMLFAALVRAQALEEAAAICESISSADPYSDERYCAKKIRAAMNEPAP